MNFLPGLKSEFRKIFTIRSTYIVSLVALAFIVLTCFYVIGYKDSEMNEVHKWLLAGAITQISNIISVFGAIIGLLVMSHEYRYNLVVYTMTASNSRSKILISKILSLLVFIFFFSVILGAIALGLIYLGAVVAGHTPVHQEISYLTFFGKLVLYCELWAMVGLLFITLIRHQMGAFVVLFIVPNIVNGIFAQLLKHNAVYLPFNAINEIIKAPELIPKNGVPTPAEFGSLTPPRAALLFGSYLLLGWAVAWILFLRRDAN